MRPDPFFVSAPVIVRFICLVVLLASFASGQTLHPRPPTTGAAEPTTPNEVFGEGVRSTPWQTPEQELDGFHLPPGFEIRLFASEPQIAKPLNIAFDDLGRLWMTQSTTYPYPAESGASASDAVMVLSDEDGDGRADRFQEFAGGLNIPIGVMPYGDGCLCFSIPNIWYLRDRDGDGRCDERTRVLGPFDTSRDTHGMVNALRDGGDGWIYACHGFSNQSEIAGADGHLVRLVSGNTFRFRPDGSRVELVTRGQVNPFGMTEDDWGYRYSADCHSKPITQLISGACYPSFGRPDDGLGFLPPMLTHLHGSTAISGIAYIGTAHPLQPLRGQFLSGNVMTSRINRNLLRYRGATARGEELPDFLTSDDPWFRPVDIRVGPDGNIYVADFYNRIIGHYEVPLDHPGRDRQSGRIWQIRHAKSGHTVADHPTVAQQLRKFADGELGTADDTLHRAVWTQLDERSKVARFKLASASSSAGAMLRRHAVETLQDPGSHPHVVRAAAEVLGRVDGDADADARELEAMLTRLEGVSREDPVLRQTLRIAIRRRLRSAENTTWRRWCDDKFRHGKSTAAAELADIVRAIPSERAAASLLGYLRSREDVADQEALIQHVAEHASGESLDRCVAVCRESVSTRSASPERSRELLELIAGDGDDRIHHAGLRDWAADLALSATHRLLRQLQQQQFPVRWLDGDGTPWPLQERVLEDGRAGKLISSHALGERYVGVLRTEAFPAPSSIGFSLAGHNGRPNQPDSQANHVRLVFADGGNELFRATPPRRDKAVRVEWDTRDVNGKLVRLECVDNDDASAYAWIALGNFDPDWLGPGSLSSSLKDAVELTEKFELNETRDTLRDIAAQQSYPPGLRLRIVAALPARMEDGALNTVVRLHQYEPLPHAKQLQLLAAVFEEQGRQDRFKTIVTALDAKQQDRLVKIWSESSASVDRLLVLLQKGLIALDSLRDERAIQALRARALPRQQERLNRLLRSLRPRDVAQQNRLADASDFVSSAGTDAAQASLGAALFKKHCVSCHQLRGEGAIVGPQLDGTVERSKQRLLEDILLPNRNVDAAFRTVALLLEDGRVVVGMVQSEENGKLRVADPTGSITTVDADSVVSRRPSQLSLMPANFGELLSDRELASLLAFVKSSNQ